MGSPFCEGICPWPYLRWLRSESDRNGESLGRPLHAPKSHDVRPTLHQRVLQINGTGKQGPNRQAVRRPAMPAINESNACWLAGGFRKVGRPFRRRRLFFVSHP